MPRIFHLGGIKINLCNYYMFFHETNKKFIYCHLQMNSFSIYLPHFANDLSKQYLVFLSNNHQKYLRYSISLKVGRWEIIGISEQDALSKITFNIHVNRPYQVPKKKPGTDIRLYLIPDRIGCGANKKKS